MAFGGTDTPQIEFPPASLAQNVRGKFDRIIAGLDGEELQQMLLTCWPVLVRIVAGVQNASSPMPFFFFLRRPATRSKLKSVWNDRSADPANRMFPWRVRVFGRDFKIKQTCLACQTRGVAGFLKLKAGVVEGRGALGTGGEINKMIQKKLTKPRWAPEDGRGHPIVGLLNRPSGAAKK